MHEMTARLSLGWRQRLEAWANAPAAAQRGWLKEVILYRSTENYDWRFDARGIDNIHGAKACCVASYLYDVILPDSITTKMAVAQLFYTHAQYHHNIGRHK